jgi:NADPH:quinone reductase
MRNVPGDRLLKLPAAIREDVATAMLLRGLTAEYLLRRLYRVNAGDQVLVHAAAGGMGLILCQRAHASGARVIGTVGSQAKFRIAQDHGCDDVIDFSREDFASRPRNGGQTLSRRTAGRVMCDRRSIGNIRYAKFVQLTKSSKDGERRARLSSCRDKES